MARLPVCDISDLPVGARVIAGLGEDGAISVGVFNVNGEIVAFCNQGPHAGAPVCVGTLGDPVISTGFGERHLEHEGCILTCPWHARQFKLPKGSR